MTVYTLSKHTGISVKMIEQHYGHLNPKMQADVITGRRYVPTSVETESAEENQPKLKVVK
jgi:hypothetical protein